MNMIGVSGGRQKTCIPVGHDSIYRPIQVMDFSSFTYFSNMLCAVKLRVLGFQATVAGRKKVRMVVPVIT